AGVATASGRLRLRRGGGAAAARRRPGRRRAGAAVHAARGGGVPRARGRGRGAPGGGRGGAAGGGRPPAAARPRRRPARGRRARLRPRREAGEFLGRVVGSVELRGERLAVRPGVFVPRQRTALLIEQTLVAVRGRERPVVLEACCGVAPVAALVARRVPGADL